MARDNMMPFTTRTAGRFGRAGLALGALALAAAAAVAIGPRITVLADERAPYLDPAQPIDARVEDLLGRLTLEEKVGARPRQRQVPRGRRRAARRAAACGPPTGRTACARRSSVDSWAPAGWTTDFATAMPTGIALAATWSPELAELYGRTVGDEARARGKHVILGPGAQHPADAPLRPQLRLLRRGPVARRPHDRRLREGHAGRADDRLHQALRRSTTRSRTAARSTCRSTSARCARSTCPRSRRACARAGRSR